MVINFSITLKTLCWNRMKNKLHWEAWKSVVDKPLYVYSFEKSAELSFSRLIDWEKQSCLYFSQKYEGYDNRFIEHADLSLFN